MVYTEGDVHLVNICLMENLLNDKKNKRWSQQGIYCKTLEK